MPAASANASIVRRTSRVRWARDRWLAGSRLVAFARREPLLVALVILAATAYGVYSIWEHDHFQSEYDLGIFDQAVWLYSRFHSPFVTINHVSVLGDHFSPILVLLAPLYWLYANPRTLLIAQGALIAASIIPVFLYARPRMGRVGAYLLAAAYALFWGISAAVAYNFHELAFAPLLLALTVYLADRGRWRAYIVALGLLLLVKEDMSIIAVFVGVWLASRGEHRRAGITALMGVVWYFVATKLAIPAFSGHPFSHWTYTAFGSDLPSAVSNVAHHPGLPFHELINDPQKTKTLTYLFVPFLFLTFYSPLAILCIPLIAEGMFSSDPTFWGMSFHHWLTIGPVLAMGAADGLRNVVVVMKRERRLGLIGGLAGAVMVFASLGIAKKFPLWQITQPGFSLARTHTDEIAREQAIHLVPPGASVTTSASMLPHFAERRQIYLLGQAPLAPETDYVVANPSALEWPDPASAAKWIAGRQSAYTRVFDSKGWIVLKRHLSP